MECITVGVRAQVSASWRTGDLGNIFSLKSQYRGVLDSFESDMKGNPVCEECERWYEHAHCHWCWDLAEFWYLPAFHLPLCGRCSRRHLVGLGPPWYPNLLERQELQVRWLFEAQARGSRYALPRDVCDRVAGFLAEFWRP